MPRKSAQISIIQFSSQRITRMRCQRGSKGVHLLELDQKSGAWSTQDDSLALALKTFSDEHRLQEDELYSVLPRHEVTVRILTLPTHNGDEAARMIRLSMDEYVPYSPDELIVDQCILEELDSGESRVLAVFAHRDAVHSHIEVLRQAGLEPQRVFLSTACLASAAVAARKAADARYAVADLASGGLEVAVIDRGHLQYSRGIATQQDWRQAGDESSDARQELAIELRGSLAAYRRESEDGVGVDTIYLSSSWVPVQAAATALQEELLRDVLPADFASSLLSSGSAEVEALPLVLLGAALTVQERASVVIDLLPADVQRGRQFETTKRQARQFASLAVLVLAALGLLFLQSAWQRKGYIGDLEEQLGEIRPSAEQVVSMQRDLRILDLQVSGQENVLGVLAAVVQAAPESDLNITQFEYDREGGVALWGRAKSVNSVHTFIDAIRALAQGQLAFLANAHSMYERQTQERDQTVYQFNIEIPTAEEPDVEE